jgi:hypothetical protein
VIGGERNGDAVGGNVQKPNIIRQVNTFPTTHSRIRKNQFNEQDMRSNLQVSVKTVHVSPFLVRVESHAIIFGLDLCMWVKPHSHSQRILE